MSRSLFITKMLFWFVICFLIPESETQIYYSTSNTTYCYDNHPPSNSRPPQPLPFCVECGCFETGPTEHTLRCGENEVIRMEFSNNQIKSLPYNHDINTCILTRDINCYNGFRVTNQKTRYTDRIIVYRNCTLHSTCTITASPVEEGNVKLVRYPYVCESNIQDISKPFSKIQSNPVFYFKGIDYINKTIDCDCSVYNSPKNIEVEIFYIHGDNICDKLDILPDTNVLSCEEGVQLYTASKNIQSKFLKIEIRNMTVTGDEVVFFKVHGDDLNVICTGCINRPESVDTPNTTTLSAPILAQQTTSTNLDSSSTNYKQSTNTNSEQISSDLNRKTSSESTTTNLNTGQTSGQNEADFISRTEHEEKLNQTYAMFGGIIAGILILVLLGIGIYCFVRKRRQLEKVKKENQQPVSPPDNNGGEYTHYNYVELDVLKETESSNKETETSKPNKSDGQSTNSQPAQQKGAVQKTNENNMEIDSTVSPNLYYEFEAEFESENTKKTDALRKLEEKKQTNEVYSVPKKFYAEKQKAVTQEQKEVTQEQKAITQEQKEVTQERKAVTQEQKSVTQEQKEVTQEQKGANIFSNTNDPVEDTYNHIGDSNKLTPKALTQEQTEVTQEQKAVTQEQKGPKSIPNIVSNTDNPVDDTYNHIGDTNKLTPKAVTQEQKGAKSLPNIVSNTDNPVDDTYNHIGETNKLVPKAVTQEQKGAKSLPNIVSNTDDPVEDTYNHIGDTNKLLSKAVTQEQKGAKSLPNIVSNTDNPVDDTYNHIGDTNKLMPKAVTQEQKGAKSLPNIVSNTDDPAEDTYNHIRDTNKPITGRIKVLPKKYTKPIAKLKPIRYNHNPTENVPATVVTLNPNQPDNLNHPTDKPKSVRYNHNPTETESEPTTVVTLNPNQPDNLNNPTDKPTPVRYNHNPTETESEPTTVVTLNQNQPDNLNNPTDKPKPVRYNHNPTDSVPTTLNQNQPENLINRQVKPNPSTDDYSHVNVKTQQFPKPSQTNYDHIDDRLVIMDSPVDRENTYSHIENLPKVKTPQPSPRMKDKVPQSDDLSTAEDFYENVVSDQEVKADNSVEATSLYNDEFEDTYNHLESTGIVNL